MTVYALSQEFWYYSEESERRFKRALGTIGLPALILGLIIPFMQLAGLERGGGQQGESRYVQLLEEVQAPVAEEAEEPAPEPEPEPVTQEPAPRPQEVVEPERPDPALEQQRAREIAQQSGVMAFADQLADLRDQALPGLDPTQTLTSGVIGSTTGAPGGTGLAFNQAATATSGGIGTGDVRRREGGTGIGERRTTTVERPQGVGPEQQRMGQGGNASRAGRTFEEIDLVFERNKSAFYSIYSRALRDVPNLQGRLTIKLTIAPDGSVTACDLVSSDLGDPELERKVIARVRSLNFGRKDVDTITINKMMEFFPAGDA